MWIGNDCDKIGNNDLSLPCHVRFAAEPAKAPKAFARHFPLVVGCGKSRVYSVDINYDIFTRALASQRYAKPDIVPEVRFYTCGSTDELYAPVALPLPDTDILQAKAWDKAIAQTVRAGGFLLRERRADVGPQVPYALTELGNLPVEIPAGKPYVVNDVNRSATWEIGHSAKSVMFFGQASMPYGYPVDGERGEKVGSYIIRYANGIEQEIPLRNGMEIVTALCLHRASTIEPMGSHITKAFELRYDTSWEIYQANLLKVSTISKLLITSITLTVTSPDYSVLLYGITLGI